MSGQKELVDHVQQILIRSMKAVKNITDKLELIKKGNGAMHKLLIILLLLLPVDCFAAGKEPLKGIQAFLVTILPMNDVEKVKIPVGRIRTDVELHLRKAGIKVIPEEERAKKWRRSDVARLTVGINGQIIAVGNPLGFPIALNLTVDVVRQAAIDCESGENLFMTAWDMGLVGFDTLPNPRSGTLYTESNGNKIYDGLKPQMLDILDQMMNDYFAINQK